MTAELEARRRQVLRTYAAMISSQISLMANGNHTPRGNPHLTAVALVSATDGLISDRVTDPKRRKPSQQDRNEIIATLTNLFAAAIW